MRAARRAARATRRASRRSRRCRPAPGGRCARRMTSANGTSAIGRCTEVAATPRAVVHETGDAEADADDRIPRSAAGLLDRWETESRSAAVSAWGTAAGRGDGPGGPRRPRPPGASCLPGRRRSRRPPDMTPATIQRCMTRPERHRRASRVHEVPLPPEALRPRRSDCRGGRAGRASRASSRRSPGGAGSRRPGRGASCGGCVLALVGWVVLSAVLFLVSAQIEQGKVSDAADAQLGGAGFPLTSPNTILVLGSDQRGAATKPSRAPTSGRAARTRSCCCASAAGTNARLSIPRDTVADIPGHGRSKINAAYAFGGAALADPDGRAVPRASRSTTSSRSTSRTSRGSSTRWAASTTRAAASSPRSTAASRNGGYTLRLAPGKTHIDGKQALALARTRKNPCNARENDLTRARRQQKHLRAR